MSNTSALRLSHTKGERIIWAQEEGGVDVWHVGTDLHHRRSTLQQLLLTINICFPLKWFITTKSRRQKNFPLTHDRDDEFSNNQQRLRALPPEMLPWKRPVCAAYLKSVCTALVEFVLQLEGPLWEKASAPAEGPLSKALNSYELLGCCSESRIKPWPLTHSRGSCGIIEVCAEAAFRLEVDFSLWKFSRGEKREYFTAADFRSSNFDVLHSTGGDDENTQTHSCSAVQQNNKPLTKERKNTEFSFSSIAASGMIWILAPWAKMFHWVIFSS